MRHVIGQATGRAGRLLHRLSRLVLVLVLIVLMAGVGLAWRLGQGPLTFPWLTALLIDEVNEQIAPMRLSVAEASLVWEGFTGGVDRPLDIRARNVALHDGSGQRIALVPQIELSLSLRALATGDIAARGLSIEGTRLRLERRQDGTLNMRYDDETSADIVASSDRSGPDLAWLYAALAEPPGTDNGPRATLISQLRRLRLHDSIVTVNDHRLGLEWRATRVDIDLTRAAAGGLTGTANLGVEIAGQTLSMAAHLALPAAAKLPPGASPMLSVEATMPTIVPADFATIAPPFAPLAAVHAPVALTATAKLAADLWPHEGKLRALLSAGTLHIGRGRLPILSASAQLVGTPEAVVLTIDRLALPAATSTMPTIVTGEARLHRDGDMLGGTVGLHLDRVAFADLAALWPDGVGGPGAKPWITQNITAGMAHDLRVDLGLQATSNLTDAALATMSGSVEGRGMTVHWLRPVPPAEGVNARVTFVSPDQIDIALLSGHQAGLVLSSGAVVLTGLTRYDQYVNITVDMAGPVAEMIAVLNHPRVNLLSRRPIEMKDPSGQVAGRLAVLALPLENDLTFDDVRLSAHGKATALNLGGVAAGRDLTDGTLTFDATNDNLKLVGTATLAGVPSQLQVDMDFTPGPLNQVIQKIGVSGSATAAQLAGFGLATEELKVEGEAALKLDYTSRRNNRAELQLRADLARLGLAAAKLNWSKPAGRPATAEAQVTFERDRPTAVDRIRVDGDGISFNAALEMAGGSPRRLRITRGTLAPSTDVQGEITWPQGTSPWNLQLSGTSLDVSGFLAERGRVTDVPPEPSRGPAWQANLRLSRVIVAPQRHIDALVVRIDNDGLISRTAQVTGRAGNGPFELSIGPQSSPGVTRHLTASAQDAGALMQALDLRDDMLGGVLSLRATYNDNAAGHPLTGTVDVSNFSVRDAPALAKLIQALSVYGVFAALSGRDMHFERLILPFRYTRDIIEVNEARAYNPSIGMTAQGKVDLGRRQIDIQGTVVPAYALNSLLGRIPLLGRLVSPETGGGLLAMTYGVRGPLDDPSVRVNPLSAVAPGFLRGIFGVFDGASGGGADSPGGPPKPNYAVPGGGQQ